MSRTDLYHVQVLKSMRFDEDTINFSKLLVSAVQRSCSNIDCVLMLSFITMNCCNLPYDSNSKYADSNFYTYSVTHSIDAFVL